MWVVVTGDWCLELAITGAWSRVIKRWHCYSVRRESKDWVTDRTLSTSLSSSSSLTTLCTVATSWEWDPGGITVLLETNINHVAKMTTKRALLIETSPWVCGCGTVTTPLPLSGIDGIHICYCIIKETKAILPFLSENHGEHLVQRRNRIHEKNLRMSSNKFLIQAKEEAENVVLLLTHIRTSRGFTIAFNRATTNEFKPIGL